MINLLQRPDTKSAEWVVLMNWCNLYDHLVYSKDISVITEASFDIREQLMYRSSHRYSDYIEYFWVGAI